MRASARAAARRRRWLQRFHGISFLDLCIGRHFLKCVADSISRRSLSRNECARCACERISMREDRCPQLSVPIDAELKARLEAAAAREDRPVASLVRRIVMQALNEREGTAAA